MNSLHSNHNHKYFEEFSPQLVGIIDLSLAIALRTFKHSVSVAR